MYYIYVYCWYFWSRPEVHWTMHKDPLNVVHCSVTWLRTHNEGCEPNKIRTRERWTWPVVLVRGNETTKKTNVLCGVYVLYTYVTIVNISDATKKWFKLCKLIYVGDSSRLICRCGVNLQQEICYGTKGVSGRPFPLDETRAQSILVFNRFFFNIYTLFKAI